MKISMSKVSMDIVSQSDLDHALRIIRELQEEAKPKDIETNVQLTADELQAVSAPLIEEDEDSVVYDDQIPGVVEPVDEVKEKPKKASKPRKPRQSASAKAGFSVFGGGLDTKKPAKPNPADSKAAFAATPIDDPVEKVEQPVDDIPFETEAPLKKGEIAQKVEEGIRQREADLLTNIEHIDLSKPEKPSKATPPVADIDKSTFLAKVRDALTHASKAEVGDVIEGIAGHRSTRDIHKDHWAEIIVELDQMLAKKVAG